jgi:hypothetical protein
MHQFFAKGGLETSDALPQPEQVLAALNIFAGRFFDEVIAPLKGCAYEPALEMLIAANFKQGSLLFCWKRNRVVWIPRSQHASIGSGVIQVHPMLRDVQLAGREDCMFFHGIRMMYHAKRAVAGVGGRTESVSLRDDGITHYFGTEAARATEDLIINFEKFLYEGIYMDISAVALDVKDLDKNVGRNLDKLPEIIRMYRDAYRKILDPQLPTESD